MPFLGWYSYCNIPLETRVLQQLQLKGLEQNELISIYYPTKPHGYDHTHMNKKSFSLTRSMQDE